MNIGQRIKQVREFHHWKQSTVAKLMQVSQQGYSALERGISFPRIDTIKKFCDVMNIQVYYFLSLDVPVTEENMQKYAARPLKDVIAEVKQMESQIDHMRKDIEKKSTRIMKEMPMSKVKAA